MVEGGYQWKKKSMKVMLKWKSFGRNGMLLTHFVTKVLKCSPNVHPVGTTYKKNHYAVWLGFLYTQRLSPRQIPWTFLVNKSIQFFCLHEIKDFQELAPTDNFFALLFGRGRGGCIWDIVRCQSIVIMWTSQFPDSRTDSGGGVQGVNTPLLLE